ncbi:hypothetical protein ACFLS7_03890 [Bacteroidota bacterium]
MKSFFTLLCCILFLGTNAQSYHPLVTTGKVWSDYYAPCDKMDPFSMYEKVTDDTIFGGYTWKKLVCAPDSTVYYWQPNGFLREEPDKKVYYTDPYGSKTWLYYDFGLAIGDTVHPLEDDITYVVDSVTDFELATGEFRERFVLRYIDPSGIGDSCYVYWIEGVGSLDGLTTPAKCMMVGDNPSLICFWEAGVLQYHNPDFAECYVITGIGDKEYGISDILIYPNPTSGISNFEFQLQELLILNSIPLLGLRWQM